MLDWILLIGGLTLLFVVFEWEVRRIIKEWHEEEAIHGWGADVEDLETVIDELKEQLDELEKNK